MADTITRSFRTPSPPFDGEPREYEVMLRYEADDRGIKYNTNWRTARAGEWVLTGDGWVGQLIDTRVSRSALRENDWIFVTRYSFATDKYIIRAKSEKEAWAILGTKGGFGSHIRSAVRKTIDDLNYEPYRRIGQGYGMVVPKSWIEVVLRSKRGKIAIEMFAKRLIANNFTFTEKDMYDIGMILRPDDELPQARAKMVYRQPEVQKKVVSRVADILNKKGIDMNWVIQKTMDAVDLAESTGNPGKMLEGIDRIHAHVREGSAPDEKEANWELLESTTQERPEAKQITSPATREENFEPEKSEADPEVSPEE